MNYLDFENRWLYEDNHIISIAVVTDDNLVKYIHIRNARILLGHEKTSECCNGGS